MNLASDMQEQKETEPIKPLIDDSVFKVYSRFHKPHYNLLNIPGRLLLHEATIRRQGRSSIVDRIGFLFTDLLVLGKQDSKKLVMKQVIELKSGVIDVHDCKALSSTKIPFPFIFTSQDIVYVFGTNTQEDEKIWIDKIWDAVCDLVFASNDPVCQIIGWRHYFFTGTIHQSTLVGDEDTFDNLVKSDNIDIVDCDGFTALHFAVQSGNAAALEKLLSFKADPKIEIPPDSPMFNIPIATTLDSAENVFLLAAWNGVHQLITILAPFFPTYLDRALRICVLGSNREFLLCSETLISLGANIDFIFEKSGYTTFHDIFRLGKDLPDLCSSILVYGLQLDSPSSICGKTSLHFAAERGLLNVSRILIENGAQPMLRDMNLNTPLHLCTLFSLSLLLVHAGARLDALNSKNRLPTVQFSESEVAQLQIERKRRSELPDAAGSSDQQLANMQKMEVTNSWVDDGATNWCMICLDAFSFMNRKHHCRRCGLLLCGNCCLRRAHFLSSSLRVCDGCFNQLFAIQTMLLRKRESERQQRSPVLEIHRKEPGKHTRKDLEKPTEAKVLDNAEAAKSEFSQMMHLAEERGQKLEDTALKSSQLASRAADFAQAARKLSQQQKSRSWWDF